MNPFDKYDTPAAGNPFDKYDTPEVAQDGPLTRGYNQAKNSAMTLGNLAVGDAAGAAQRVAEAAAYRKANPGSPEGNELMAAWERGDGVMGGVSEVAGEIAKDWREAPSTLGSLRATGKNLAAMGGGILEQLPNMVLPMAGMAAGGFAGAPGGLPGVAGGAFIGGGLGNTAMETGEQVVRALHAAGIDPEDRPAVEAFLAKNGDSVLGTAATKGAIISAVDTLSLGAGHMLLTAPARAAADRALVEMGVDVADKAAVAAARKSPAFAARVAADAELKAATTGAEGVARNVGAAALEPASEFAGEYVGQGVATGDWDTKGAALEALSSLGQSGAVFLGQKGAQALLDPRRGQAGQQEQLAALPTNEALNAANQDVQAAMDAYQAQPEQALLPDRGIQMPAPPPDGTLASAAYTAAQTGASQQDPTAQLLRAYPTPEAAQAELDQRPDAAYLSIIPHPRADSGYAVVRKSPGEVAQIQQAEQDQALGAAATQEAQVRQEQLAQEEEAAKQESNVLKTVVDLNRNAAALEKSISESTPPAEAQAIRAQAADLRARAEEIHQQAKAERQAAAVKEMTLPPADGGAVAQAQAGDLAQDELAPTPVQPVAEMPATQAAEAQKAQAAQAQVQAANTAGLVRQTQLAQEETPTVDEAAGRANTAPTDKQKEAGNYAKGHITVGGLQVAVENPVGSSRTGIEGGKSWTTRMKAHYGYVKRTTGADGDQVDVYVKPGTKTDHAGPVFVVDQYNPSTGAFDEHKVLMGYGSQAEAAKAYDAHFGDKTGPARRGAVTQMSVPAFKQWLKNGDTTMPVSANKFGGQPANEADAAQEEIRQSGGRLSARRGETPDQRLARLAAESNTRKQQAKVSGLRTREEHEAAINQLVGIDDAQVVTEMSGADKAAPGQVSKQGADFIRQVARLFKKKVVFYRSEAGSVADGGWRADGDVIYLNSTSSVAQLRVLGHELVHAMRAQAPEAFEAMRKGLANLLTDEQLAAQHKDYFGTELTQDLDKPAEGTDGATLRDFLAEEWMADLAGNRFAEGKFWSDLFSDIEARQGTTAAKGLVARLRMAVSNAINQLLQVIKGGKFSVDTRVADQLEQVRAAVKDGFVAYEKASRAGTLQAVVAESQRQSAKRPESDAGHKRTSKGEYVGAPVGMTPAKLGALRKRLLSLAKEGEPGRFWYEDSSRLILAAAEGDAARAEKIAGLLAIYSPNATVSANTTMGLKALYQWMNGDPIKVRFAGQDTKAEAWMDGSMAEEDAMQIKTGNFFRNLMRKIDEERYGFEQQGATIDMWMARVFGYNSKAVGSAARYYFAERGVTRLAESLGWEPQQVQAALWVAIKSRIEAVADDVRAIGQKKGWLKKVEKTSKGKTSISWVPIDKAAEEQYEGLMLKTALGTEPDPSGLTKAAYHFGTALRERIGQISWEALPGKTTGVLPGIFNAPLAQQAEYLAAIDQALRDEDGQDLVAKKLGLPVISTAFGPSAWQMHVGSGAQTEVAIPVVKGEGVTSSARELLNAYAAIRGYVLAQEAVVWHYPVFDASKKNANGVQLDFGRDPTHEEVAQLYQAIYDVSGRDDWAPAYVPGVGVRVLNFSDVPNLEFHSVIRKALQTDGVPDAHITTFQSEGDYVGNDWVEHPDGAQYKEQFNGQDSQRNTRGSGRPDLQGWVEGELRPRVERVNQEFADRYGWGKSRLSTRRLDAPDGGRAGAPSYGVRQQGAVSLLGFHYSREARTALSGRFYGQGLKGAEAQRLGRESAVPEQQHRIYYYVDEGAGIKPEPGVGEHLHTTQLENLYDLKVDPLGIWKAIVGGTSSPEDRLNFMEQQVMLQGFDGYYVSKAFGSQGAVVLVGSRHTTVPVGYVGQKGQVEVSSPEVPPAAPAELSAEKQIVQAMFANKGLPGGAMSGSDWGRMLKALEPAAHALLEPTGIFEKPGPFYKDELVRGSGIKLSRQRTISDLSPGQEAAADRVLGAPRTFGDRWLAFKKDWAKNLKQGIFDQFAPILELDPNAYMQARLSKGGDSTVEALLLYGKLRLDASGATDVDYTEAGGFQGFASKMAPLGQEQDRFLLWVAAQRADRLKQIGLENLWSDQDIRELSTLDQGVMADGGARPAVYAQALADLNDFNDNVLSIAEASGLISSETRQMFQDQPYVPFYRLQEEGIQGFGMKPGLVNQAAWKRLKGGTEKLNEDLLANVLKNWSHLITASAKNRAAVATLTAASQAGAAVAVPTSTTGKDLVRVRVQGQERAFAVLDPHLLDAVAALEYAGLGPWSKPLTAAKHWLTIGVTANPTFKLRNLMRDSISAIGVAQLSYNPAKNIGQGWGSTSKESETRAHMLASGGMIRFGSMLGGNSSRRAQTLIERGVDPALILDSDSKIQDFWNKRLRPALDAYNELGDRVENINRAALYDQLVANGMSHMEASYWARDLMDFSMSGKWTAIRGLVQMVPFFNARLQGLYKLGRAGKQDLKRLGTVLGAVSLFSLGLLFAAKADDEDWKAWQARPDEDRNNYWWFTAGGKAYRIPKPFEIGAVGTIAERGFEIMSDDEMTPKRFGRVMSQIVLSQLSMNPTPQLFKPMMDIYANQDGFTGMPIEGPALEGLRKEDRYDSRTSMAARFLGSLGLPNPTQLAMGRWDTLSPKQIDYLARGYFSWLATMTTVALDFGIRPLVSSGERPTRTLRETFFVGNFVEQLPANGSRYVQNLYEQAREVEQAYASYQAQVRVGNAEGARRILSEERDKIARYRQVEQFKRAESLLTLQQRRIEEDPRLSGDEKRTRLDLLQQRKNLLAQQFPGV